MIPQISGWALFVGLKTGRIPVRGGEEVRAESPMWFWLTAACYGFIALLIPIGLPLLVLASLVDSNVR